MGVLDVEDLVNKELDELDDEDGKDYSKSTADSTVINEEMNTENDVVNDETVVVDEDEYISDDDMTEVSNCSPVKHCV